MVGTYRGLETQLLLVVLACGPVLAASRNFRLSPGLGLVAREASRKYEDAATPVASSEGPHAPQPESFAAMSDGEAGGAAAKWRQSEEFRVKLNRLAMIMSNTGVLVQENERLRDAAKQGPADVVPKAAADASAGKEGLFGGMPLDRIIVLGSTLVICICCSVSILVIRHYDALEEEQEEKDSKLHLPFPGSKTRFVCGGWISSDLARGLLTVLMAASMGFCFLWWADIIQPFLKNLVVWIYLGFLVLMLVWIFGSMLMKEMGMMSFVLTSLMKGIHEMQDIVTMFEEQVSSATGGCGSRRRNMATNKPGAATSEATAPASGASTPRKARGAGCL